MGQSPWSFTATHHHYAWAPILPAVLFDFLLCDKDHDQKQREERVYLAYMSRSQLISEGSRGRDSGNLEADTEAETKTLIIGLLSMTSSACFLKPPRTICWGEGETYPDHVLSISISYQEQTCLQACLMEVIFSGENHSSHMSLACVWLTKS